MVRFCRSRPKRLLNAWSSHCSLLNLLALLFSGTSILPAQYNHLSFWTSSKPVKPGSSNSIFRAFFNTILLHLNVIADSMLSTMTQSLLLGVAIVPEVAGCHTTKRSLTYLILFNFFLPLAR